MSSYEMTFEYGPTCALSTPALVYDESVKYHVPGPSSSIRTVVAAGSERFMINESLAADWPYRIL